MNRREVIKRVSLLTGAAISAPLMSSLLTGCKKVEKLPDSDSDSGYTPLFFNENEFDYIRTIADIILPKTDSPSATDVNVHKIIDLMLSEVYKPQDKKYYAEGISSLTKYLDDFLELNNTEQIERLRHLQQLNTSADSNVNSAKLAFLDLKQQTIAYYLSTEEIAKNYLNYLPIPGKYEPCISLKETGGKAWAI